MRFPLKFFPLEKIQRPVGFYFSRIKKSSGGEDSATGQCGESFQQTRTNFCSTKWRRYAVSKRCRAALRRLGVGVWTAVQVGSILRRAALR
jgi:hypothetical protein